MPITTLSDDDLFTGAVDAINQAAAGEARGGDDASCNHAMTLMAESKRRHTAAGHTARCSGDIYSRAFEQATADHARRTATLPTCSRGAA